MELCPNVYSEFALVLTTLLQQNLDGHVDFVGESGAPEILYWFRKAADTVHITSQDQLLLQDLNFLGKKKCALCRKQSNNLKTCKRCGWASYCGRECQLDHWDKGHTADCKKKY